ncbi:response regulator transcription factor [Micrococcales bacterium 31B]|nr:response regulator transcription factor [Micrococcales bacterium 31B]
MRIVLAEDSVLLQQGLARLLELNGYVLLATVANADDLLRAVEAFQPEAAIVDVRMPPTFTDEGIRAAVTVRERWPDTAVLVLSQYVEEKYAAELIASGARGFGYLLKDRVADVESFLAALAQVAAGGTVLDPEVVSQIMLRSRQIDHLERLTPRELEVLTRMAEGDSNSAIAAKLFISEGSVEKHISAIFAKLDLPSSDTENRRVLAVVRYLNRM